jgi:RND superfamily putative drug exporter
MLFYPGSFLPSLGLAGGIVVAFAVFYALTLLPAILVLLGLRVNRLSLPYGVGKGGGRFWHRLATAVMRRPIVVLVPTVTIIVAAGVPFAPLRMANGGITQLPAQAEARQGADLLSSAFPGRDQTTIDVVAGFSGNPLSPAHVAALYDLSRRLATIPGVLRVDSIVDLDPHLTRADYQRQYAAPVSTLPAPVHDSVRQSVGQHIVALRVLTNKAAESDAARSLVRSIRADRSVGDGHLTVTGPTAFDLDIVNFIIDRTPLAVGFIVVVTCVVLFLLLGSVLLPLKAVVMNFLSLSVQDGHFHDLLHFSPDSVDPSVPVILFCIVFGLSMDYEVLLIKSIGLGMAIAVAIDATLVRALIVPAAMRLLGDANWWAPAPLTRLYRKVGLIEAGRPVVAEARF